MHSSILDNLTVQVTNTIGVIASAVVFINSVAARIQAAVDAALLNGATAAELAPVQAEADGLAAESAKLSAAIAANP